MKRHIFAGGNTPDGFYSYFNHILPLEESRKTIYMKGGSGTGKSTFMKRVGELFEQKNYDIECFHCSNDPESLDGICIPKLKIAIVDATAPHVQDPAVPVAVDEILNVAVCLNRKGLQKYADELKSILSSKKQLIQMAYGYLHGGYSVYKNNSTIYESTLNKGALNVLIQDLIQDTFSEHKVSEKVGKNRKLFATAITPSGFINHSNSLFTYKKLTVLEASEGCGGDIVLAKIQEAANIRGLNTEGYYSPLSPLQLEHLIIPELECCFTTSNEFHENDFPAEKRISLFELCNQSMLEPHKEMMEYNTKQFIELSKKAMDLLDRSREIHDRVEKIYISNMDFKKLNVIYDETVKQLLELEK